VFVIPLIKINEGEMRREKKGTIISVQWRFFLKPKLIKLADQQRDIKAIPLQS